MSKSKHKRTVGILNNASKDQIEYNLKKKQMVFLTFIFAAPIYISLKRSYHRYPAYIILAVLGEGI
jgi:hypothetical protein